MTDGTPTNKQPGISTLTELAVQIHVGQGGDKDDEPSESALLLVMESQFGENWDVDNVDRGLFDFLAICWAHSALRVRIYNATQFWSRERRELILSEIQKRVRDSPNPATQPDPTLLDRANEIEGSSPPGEESLRLVLGNALSDTNWLAMAHETGLYPFLGACWDYPALRVQVLSATQRWPKDQRNAFSECIAPYYTPDPEMEKAQQEARAKIERPLLPAGGAIEGLQLDARLRIKENHANARKILEAHEDWQGRLGFDDFRGVLTVDGNPIGDEQEERIIAWFEDMFEFSGDKPKSITRAIFSVAVENKYDSLLNWVNALPDWDGSTRIHTWMQDYCGAPEGAYAEMVSYVTIMQMMARALTPGCIARFCPIWEGPENQGKSQSVKILGGEWSDALHMNLDSADTFRAMQGMWVMEFAEMDAMRKATENRLKWLLTETKDRWTPKYSNHSVTRPRRTVFIATTNPEEGYLRGTTGNTRYLPIETGKFDMEQLAAQREQLFAEAKALLTENPRLQWWQESNEIKALLEEQREQRRSVGVYESALQEWLDGETPTSIYRDRVTMEELFLEFLKLDSREKWPQHTTRIELGIALKAAGFKRIKSHGKYYWQRQNPTELPDAPF